MNLDPILRRFAVGYGLEPARPLGDDAPVPYYLVAVARVVRTVRQGWPLQGLNVGMHASLPCCG